VDAEKSFKYIATAKTVTQPTPFKARFAVGREVDPDSRTWSWNYKCLLRFYGHKTTVAIYFYTLSGEPIDRRLSLATQCRGSWL